MFAQTILDHEQAIEMSDTLLSREGQDDRAVELATQSKDAQQPEIDQLSEWGEDESSLAGMDHGNAMTSEDDMAAVVAATGADASRPFLKQAGTAQAFTEAYGSSDTSILDLKDGYPQLAFSGTVAPNAVPTALVLDREGRFASRIRGPLQDVGILDALIASAMAEDSNA